MGVVPKTSTSENSIAFEIKSGLLCECSNLFVIGLGFFLISDVVVPVAVGYALFYISLVLKDCNS